MTKDPILIFVLKSTDICRRTGPPIRYGPDATQSGNSIQGMIKLVLVVFQETKIAVLQTEIQQFLFKIFAINGFKISKFSFQFQIPLINKFN